MKVILSIILIENRLFNMQKLTRKKQIYRPIYTHFYREDQPSNLSKIYDRVEIQYK